MMIIRAAPKNLLRSFSCLALMLPISEAASVSRPDGMTAIPPVRSLQNNDNDANYSATYRAKFQHLLDETCQGPSPTMNVLCRGNLIPVSVSDSSIACNSINNDNADDTAWSEGLACVNNCVVGDAINEGEISCEQVYLERDDIEGGIFAEILFQCQGTTLEEVDAIIEYASGDPGSCSPPPETDGVETPTSRNYHVAQLEVRCPVSLSFGALSSYIAPEDYVECSNEPSTTVAIFQDRYTCYTGQDCQALTDNGDDCEVLYDKVVVSSRHENFYDCIDSLNVDFPVPSPEDGEAESQTAPPSSSPGESTTEDTVATTTIPTLEPTVSLTIGSDSSGLPGDTLIGTQLPNTPATSSPTASTGAVLDIPVSTTGAPIGIPVATSSPGQPSTSSTTASPATTPTTDNDATSVPTGVPGEATTTLSPTTTSSEPVAPPPGTTYRVSYMGRFQQVLSPGCEDVAPTLVIICTGTVENIVVSDPTISCESEPLPLDDGREAVICTNSCREQACYDIYKSAVDMGGAAPFGEILFECQGDSVASVAGQLIWISDGEPGFCDGADDNSSYEYNLRVAQLGILCPSNETDTERSYIIDDFYSECGDGIGGSTQVINLDGNYTCYTGLDCRDNKACQVTYQQLVVNADPHKISQCIESSNDSPIPQVGAPATGPRDKGLYTARFLASWDFQLDQDDCSGNISLKKVTCTNGVIGIVEVIASGDACSVVGDDTIECFEETFSTFGALIYECKANDDLPGTHIEYATGEASCDSFDNQTVEHALQLGILCSLSTGESFIHWDLFLECGELNDFDLKDGNFTCLSSTTIPSTADNTAFPISTVEIMTDFRWPLSAPTTCFSFNGSRRLYQRSLPQESIFQSQLNSINSKKRALHEPRNLKHLLHKKPGNLRHAASEPIDR